MQPTPAGWPTSFDESAPTHTVVIEGAAGIDVDEWELTRQITGGLPAQVRGVNGMSIASGRLIVSPSAEVAEVPLTPFGVAPTAPEVEADVTISTGFGGAEVPVFTGQAYAVDGSALDAAAELTIQDPAVRMHSRVSMDPAANLMHPSPSGAGATRKLSLTALWAMDHIARGAGFESTPNPSMGAKSWQTESMPPAHLLAPYQGGYYSVPGRGVPVDMPLASGDPWEAAPWGWGVWPTSTAERSYAPSSAPPWAARTFVLQGLFDSTLGRSAYVRIEWADGTYISLECSTAGNMQARVRQAGVTSTPAALTGSWSGASRLIASTVFVGGDPFLRVTLQTPDGQTATGTMASGTVPSGNASRVRVGGRMAGACVWTVPIGQTMPPGDHIADWRPTFLADPSLNRLTCTPEVVDEDRWSLFTEIASAEGGAAWFTEAGELVFRNRETLTDLAQPIAATVTATDELADVLWSKAAAQKYSHVAVPFYRPTVRRTYTTTGWVTALSPESERRFELEEIDASFGGATWFEDLVGDALALDTSVTRMQCDKISGSYIVIGSGGSGGPGIGVSCPGGSYIDRNYNLAGTYGTFTVTVTPVEADRVKVNLSYVPGTLSPPDVQLIGGGPVLMAKQVHIWGDEETEIVVNEEDPPGGQTWLTLPSSRWRQDTDVAAYTAWLADEVAEVRPIIRNLSLSEPDPRLQHGDHIQVEHPGMGLSSRCLVVGIAMRGTPGDLDQSLAVRPLN
ncbi:MAG TPA: hypothetical protein VIQ30_22695 [Pseudonocardia sp.]